MKKILTISTIVFLISLRAVSGPKISFFVELPGDEFQKLFADTSLITQLMVMDASLRIGLQDFSKERTETILELNKAGIQLFAWLLLPEEEGYWFNMYNGEKASERYDDFKKWTFENGLKWEGIGIDLELDFNDARMAVKHPYRLAWKAYKRLFDNRSLEKGRQVYKDLIDRMIADGYDVESYLIPFIYDERITGTTSFQKLLGLIDIRTPHEIPMVYTSAMGNPGIIAEYCQAGEAVALGITGGGVNIEGVQPRFMRLDDLIRDLLISNECSKEAIIFSLEAAFRNGWLPAIESVDYSRKPPDMTIMREKTERLRKIIQRMLIVLDHPYLMSLAFLMLVTCIIFMLFIAIKFISILLMGRAG
jgi:hypothetical protein